MLLSTDEQLSPPISTGSLASNSERHTALLSLLSPPSARGALPPAPQTHQIPTPPGSSQRSGASPSYNDAKMLLDQLMQGSTTVQRSSLSDAASVVAPSPSYGPIYGASASVSSLIDPEYRNLEYRNQSFTQHENHHNERSDISQHAPPPPPPQQQQQQQPQQQHQQGEDTPSPRKSMFDFVSPFDALSSGQPSQKRSPPQLLTASSNEEIASSWTSIQSPDPKRQSVDNLLENLTRGQYSMAAAPTQSYDSYLPPNEFVQEPLVPVQRAPLPVPPAGPARMNAHPSPRESPQPKQPVAARQAPRQVESPAGSYAVPSGQQGPRRDKESSPVGRAGSLRMKGNKNKNRASPGLQSQSIVFDVSLPLDDVQAPRDSVKSTPIALVKQDAVFLPGTTIGATHWVAYAMTRGRVRVISRSSGDRTLLQLPATFSGTSSVTDMAVHGNYLAGVTSDGGFVVWQLPDVITDDVPGTLVLNVPPSTVSPLISVKWHPLSNETLAVTSESRVYLIDLVNTHSLGSQPFPQGDLHHISQVFEVPSPLVAFDFDVANYSLATISQDSSLLLWSIRDRSAYANHKIPGEDVPSSLTFIEGGLIIGRKNGTIFQLISSMHHVMSVVSTLKFTKGAQEDYDMFGHVNYDARIRTLWIANSRRNSLIAARVGYDAPPGDELQVAYFEQVCEFVGPKPTIHFVILTADADPHGDESLAACVAAKEPPGELALVAFSVHSSGVDQVLVRKEWYTSAFSTAPAKFPFSTPAMVQPSIPAKASQQFSNTTVPITVRPTTPQSEEVEVEMDINRDDPKTSDGRNKGTKSNKAVVWAKERDESKDKAPARTGDVSPSDHNLAQSLAKEIKKTEENLHSRLGRLIGKEMDKQNQRLEEARVYDQTEDIARQEKLLRLISTELTKNTTRVVEMAVKSEVQNSVLPSLETIVKTEIKSAMADHVGRGLADYIGHNLPGQIENIFRRPDVSKHISQLISTTFTPVIESNVKEAFTQNFLPLQQQQQAALNSDLLREFRAEMYRMKTDLSGWQNEAFRNQEKIIRNLEHNVQTLADQVKFLSHSANLPMPGPSNAAPLLHLQTQANSSPHSNNHSQLRQVNQPPPTIPVSASYPPASSGNYQAPAQNHPAHQQWYGPAQIIAAPQASHPVTVPQAGPTSATSENMKERTPPVKPEQWDDIYLSMLHSEDPLKLRELLSKTNPELVMPLNGTSLVSQAVILTLIHRLSVMASEVLPTDEIFKTYVWWLQRAVNVLNPNDKIITDFIPRVVPNIQKSLNTTKQRLTLVPSGPQIAEIARIIADVSEILRRKANSV